MHNDISNELRNILGLPVKSRTFNTKYRPIIFIHEVEKTMKQPKRGTFEIKTIDFLSSALYKMDEIDERQLQETGTGSITLHE